MGRVSRPRSCRVRACRVARARCGTSRGSRRSSRPRAPGLGNEAGPAGMSVGRLEGVRRCHADNVSGRTVEHAVLCATRVRGRSTRAAVNRPPCRSRQRNAPGPRSLASRGHEAIERPINSHSAGFDISHLTRDVTYTSPRISCTDSPRTSTHGRHRRVRRGPQGPLE